MKKELTEKLEIEIPRFYTRICQYESMPVASSRQVHRFVEQMKGSQQDHE